MEIVTGTHVGRIVTFVVVYALFVILGISQLADPSPLVLAVYGSWHALWAWSLIVGGVLGGVGVATDLWIVEIGSPLLLAAPFLAWGWIVIRAPGARLGSAVILLIIVLYVLIRGGDIWWSAKHAPRRP